MSVGMVTQAHGTEVLIVVSDLFQEPLECLCCCKVEDIEAIEDRDCLSVELPVHLSQCGLAGDFDPLFANPLSTPVA